MNWAIAISLWIVAFMSLRKVWNDTAIGQPIPFTLAVVVIDLWFTFAGIWEVTR